MSRPKLSVIHGLDNDLPPKWDGEPVEWLGWHTTPTTMIHHAPVDQFACDACGAIDFKFSNSGMQYCKTSGHMVRYLAAFRCQHCKFDQVLDMRTNQSWDLDPSDYNDEGSYELGQGELL